MLMSKNVKKVCFVNPGINIRRPISFIMNLLKKKAYKISILTPRKKSDLKRENTRHYDDFKEIELITYPVWTKSSGFIWPIPTNLEFFKKCWKVLKHNDIIHVWVPFYPNTFIICLLKLIFFKRKTLILTMDTFPAYSFKTSPTLDILFKIFFKTVGKLAFVASDLVSIYGNSFVSYAKKAGIPSRKIKITPTGIDLIQKPKDMNVRENLGIKENEKIILFVGLHNNRKGIDLIIKTAKLLKDEDVKFVLVGDGPERTRSINLIRELGLSNKIIFVGTRIDMHNFYKSADVFLLPSRGEGLAGVLMEAMLYQVPIVTSNIAGTRDLITHKKNGLLCDVENYKCYANSIMYLLQNKDIRIKLQQNGIKKIEKDFLWKNNIHKFENLYQHSKP